MLKDKGGGKGIGNKEVGAFLRRRGLSGLYGGGAYCATRRKW